MPSCEMFSRLDMLLDRDLENELSSLSTRPVANNNTDYSIRRARPASPTPATAPTRADAGRRRARGRRAAIPLLPGSGTLAGTHYVDLL